MTASTDSNRLAQQRFALGLRKGDHVAILAENHPRFLKVYWAAVRSFDVSSLQDFLHSAAPCPPAVKRATIDWLGPIVSELYSGTEGMGMTFLTASEWLERPGSVGRPVLGTPVVCDEEGRPLPADDATADALRGYVREHLAGYKVPRTLEFCDHLPRLATGKVKKHDLRDAALRALV